MNGSLVLIALRIHCRDEANKNAINTKLAFFESLNLLISKSPSFKTSDWGNRTIGFKRRQKPFGQTQGLYHDLNKKKFKKKAKTSRALSAILKKLNLIVSNYFICIILNTNTQYNWLCECVHGSSRPYLAALMRPRTNRNEAKHKASKNVLLFGWCRTFALEVVIELKFVLFGDLFFQARTKEQKSNWHIFSFVVVVAKAKIYSNSNYSKNNQQERERKREKANSIKILERKRDTLVGEIRIN
ncbi:hypothetical protein BpHYR1_028793 [Brachionus plicatilis]|uniref:Uncharacterized protein n=1 Tax=Brachionus plicatilis TaxID=10195 RepID=A0A3M7RDB0_BRAPC|nr:hypothetical protein BpHYR1_028793 [Brachionus plicatilis]